MTDQQFAKEVRALGKLLHEAAQNPETRNQANLTNIASKIEMTVRKYEKD